MVIKYLKCDWGMEGYGIPKERLKKYKDAGYDGVECANIGMEEEDFPGPCKSWEWTGTGKTSLSIVHDYTCRSFKQQNKFHGKTFLVFRVV